MGTPGWVFPGRQVQDRPLRAAGAPSGHFQADTQQTVPISKWVDDMEPLLCTNQEKTDTPFSYTLGLCFPFKAGSPASPR